MVDMRRQEIGIRWATALALLACGVCFTLGFLVLPRLFDFPAALPDRLAFAARANAFVALWVLIGVGMVSLGRRFSPDDIGGAAAGPPSRRIALKVAFLQNTLEQAVIAAAGIFAYAALAQGPWLALIPVSVVLFGLGRVLFYVFYPGGGAARAFGMSLTLLPGAALLLFALGTTIWTLLAGN